MKTLSRMLNTSFCCLLSYLRCWRHSAPHNVNVPLATSQLKVMFVWCLIQRNAETRPLRIFVLGSQLVGENVMAVVHTLCHNL